MTQPTQREYPYTEGDTIVLGPQVFIDRPKQEVINYAGRNFYPRKQPNPTLLLAATVLLFLAIVGAVCFISWLAATS